MPYPESCARENCFASYYAEIAINCYYKILEIYEKYKNGKDNLEIMSEISKVHKNQMICCAFAEMALESFFNDYAAACLGDDEFYDEFDKLSVLGKFQMIVQFIFHKVFDKSKAYYSQLKELVRERNNLVHNKSRYVKPEVLEMNTKYCEECSERDFDAEEYYKEELSYINQSLKESKRYIKAMVSVAGVFNDYDVKFHPFVRLFGGVYLSLKREYANTFAKEFGFKWGEGVLGLKD